MAHESENSRDQYDFFSMGLRAVRDGLEYSYQKAEEIEKKFGVDARLEFEVAIAMATPAYSNYRSMVKEKELREELEKQVEHGATATRDYGVANTRNNSYFGTKGTGIQYNPEGKFNNPKLHK